MAKNCTLRCFVVARKDRGVCVATLFLRHHHKPSLCMHRYFYSACIHTYIRTQSPAAWVEHLQEKSSFSRTKNGISSYSGHFTHTYVGTYAKRIKKEHKSWLWRPAWACMTLHLTLKKKVAWVSTVKLWTRKEKSNFWVASIWILDNSYIVTFTLMNLFGPFEGIGFPWIKRSAKSQFSPSFPVLVMWTRRKKFNFFMLCSWRTNEQKTIIK